MTAAALRPPSRSANTDADWRRKAILFRRVAMDRDERAREELIASFMPLAKRLASRYHSNQEPFEDLVQVATIGLIGAVDRFDPTRGVTFTSFAVPTILGELKRHFRTTGWAVHVPRDLQELSLRIDRTAIAIARDCGRPATPTQIAERLAIGSEEVLRALEAARAHYATSLDAPVRTTEDDGETPLVERLGADEDRYGLIEIKLSFAATLDRLPHTERRALRLRLTRDLTQSEIAEIMGCSQMQVSRLLSRAATRLESMTNPDIPRWPLYA